MVVPIRLTSRSAHDSHHTIERDFAKNSPVVRALTLIYDSRKYPYHKLNDLQKNCILVAERFGRSFTDVSVLMPWAHV